MRRGTQLGSGCSLFITHPQTRLGKQNGFLFENCRSIMSKVLNQGTVYELRKSQMKRRKSTKFKLCLIYRKSIWIKKHLGGLEVGIRSRDVEEHQSTLSTYYCAMNEIIDSLFYAGSKNCAVVSRAHAFIVFRPRCFGAASGNVVWRRTAQRDRQIFEKSGERWRQNCPSSASSEANKCKIEFSARRILKCSLEVRKFLSLIILSYTSCSQWKCMV